MNLEFLFYLIQKFEGIQGGSVHLINKYHYRSLPHTAYIHQLPGLGLHAPGCINNNNHTVGRSQCPESILGKILVPRSIKDINFEADKNKNNGRQ